MTCNKLTWVHGFMALPYTHNGLRNTSPWCGDKGNACIRSINNPINTLRPRQNRRYFADDIFKCISLNENVWIAINISLNFVPKGLINHIPALVQIMAWRRPGDKPLSEPMMISLPTHICVTRPQWVKSEIEMYNNATANTLLDAHR